MRSTVFGRPELSKKTLSLPKAWSHQNQLRNLIGQPIQLMFRNTGNWLDCLLLETDQFTVHVELPVCKSKVTYFKHSIEGFKLKS